MLSQVQNGCKPAWWVQAYLGSESEEEDDPSQADADRYRQLLTGATDVHRPAAKGWGGAADPDEEEVGSHVYSQRLLRHVRVAHKSAPARVIHASNDRDDHGRKLWQRLAQGASSDEAGQAAQDRTMELEVTFGSGLDALGQRLKAKREEAASQKSDTVWQAYLRRRKCGPLPWFCLLPVLLSIVDPQPSHLFRN